MTDLQNSHCSWYKKGGTSSIVKAAQKGTHDVIVSPQEADRYVIYTYMIVGDILSLLEDTPEQSNS